jgi:nucleotidyltransferase/DNA polymerase involved in DNA repair
LFRNDQTRLNVQNETIDDDDGDENEEINSIMRKTDEEIAELLSVDEFFLEKYHSKTRKQKTKQISKKKDIEQSVNIYNLIRHHYTNPLSLQEIARIQIRKTMLKIDYKIKNKIENKLHLPNRIKNFLLYKEFNC